MKNVHKGKVERLWPYLVKLHKEAPDVFEDPQLLRDRVALAWTSLQDRSKCPNCGESMQEYIIKLDYHNARLLIAMADEVTKRSETMPFHEANAVHIVSLDTINDAVRHRTSQCRTLGLIAKVLNDKGKHDSSKGWLITRRGWQALAGEPVPAEVTVFRNTIKERDDKRITLAAAINTPGRGLVKYSPKDFIHFGDVNQGVML